MGESFPPRRKKKKSSLPPAPIVLNQPKALAPFQMEVVAAPWFDDSMHALIYTLVKARRVGGSEAAALRAISFLLGRRLIYDCAPFLGANGQMVHPQNGDFWEEEPMSGIVISKDWAGAKDIIAKIGVNVRELAAAGDADCIAALPHIFHTKVSFPSRGTTVEACAGSQTSIRGKTGFVILDEFAFVRNQEEVWGAVQPVHNPNWGSHKGYPVLIVSTPWEAGSFAHRLFTDENYPFHRFSIDIYEAERQGFPVNPAKVFKELGIPELIETEYLCKWSRGGESFFNMEKLRSCLVDDESRRLKDDANESSVITSGLPIGWQLSPCRIGIDCGGGVGRDFTAAVMCRFLQGKWWMVGILASNTKGTVEMAHDVAQWILDKDIVDPTVHVEVRCDRGVMGADFVTQLHKELEDRSRSSVMGVDMTSADQEVYAIGSRKLLERGQLALYVGMDAMPKSSKLDDKIYDNGTHNLMLELSRIKAKRGAGGRLTFTTPRDPLRGHCDRAWAFLMGLEGAEGQDVRQLSQGQLVRLYDTVDSRWGNMADSRGFG